MVDVLAAQLAFLTEADRLKAVTRANVLMDGSRRENTAEHSWHLALWALIFADTAPGIDLQRVFALCLLHDLVEIDAGDHPIHLPQDTEAIRRAEEAAAARLFGLLPGGQARFFHAIWEEFEAGNTPEARYVRRLDMAQPLFQELANPTQTETDRDILRQILTTGRAVALAETWPDLYTYVVDLLDRAGRPAAGILSARLRFLTEADRLKTVLRATTLMDGSRVENSAEHSWHIMLFALVLHEHSVTGSDPLTVLKMLLLHDLVEIDVGDMPIHGSHDPTEIAAREEAAADRIFGLLPPGDAAPLRALWAEFEAATSPSAVFAKSVDRVQPVLSNLAAGGRSWRDYDVTREQVEARVGQKVMRGLPDVWSAIAPRIDAWFAGQTRF